MTDGMQSPRSSFEAEDRASGSKFTMGKAESEEVSWTQYQGLYLCWEVLIQGKILATR